MSFTRIYFIFIFILNITSTKNVVNPDRIIFPHDSLNIPTKEIFKASPPECRLFSLINSSNVAYSQILKFTQEKIQQITNLERELSIQLKGILRTSLEVIKYLEELREHIIKPINEERYKFYKSNIEFTTHILKELGKFKEEIIKKFKETEYSLLTNIMVNQFIGSYFTFINALNYLKFYMIHELDQRQKEIFSTNIYLIILLLNLSQNIPESDNLIKFSFVILQKEVYMDIILYYFDLLLNLSMKYYEQNKLFYKTNDKSKELLNIFDNLKDLRIKLQIHYITFKEKLKSIEELYQSERNE
ncbi:hypothetical protein H312_02303 [Anncaliia algerae PRA339]|uniref:Secreted protein n=1 Tax=Anncaliia algerae PRA339 TaxID=1288291 RepID=A0A059EZY9_9MICR|nr:hypothetical protein H312_02303 [Anncaliia algerae PRA339]